MEIISSVLAALGHPQRLMVWKHLVARGGDAQAAGALAVDLGLKPSTLSVYLRKLVDAGLVSQEVRGTSRLYSADPACLAVALGDLGVANSDPKVRQLPLRVGFVCRDGGSRSRFAAALLNRIGQPRFLAASGGITPPRRDPLADQVLKGAGHPPIRLQTAIMPDLVIRLTRAPGPVDTSDDGPLIVHWPIPDPATGEAGIVAGLSRLGQLYRNLAKLVAALASLPVDQLNDKDLLSAVMEITNNPAAKEHTQNR